MDFDFKLPELARPESKRPRRVAEAVKNELNLLLRRGVSDPRLAGAVLSRVEVSADLKTAKLFVRAEKPEDRERVMAGAKKARGFFRSHLASVLNLRYTPEILLAYDDVAEEAERVELLLSALERERRTRE